VSKLQACAKLEQERRKRKQQPSIEALYRDATARRVLIALAEIENDTETLKRLASDRWEAKHAALLSSKRYLRYAARQQAQSATGTQAVLAAIARLEEA